MSLFSPKMKLADLIGINHNLILLLPRFGIPLGFGEKSVHEVCEKYGVNDDFLILVFNVYSFDDFQPDMETLANTDMSMLLPYLLASHQYYTNERLPHIEAHLHHIANKTEERYGKILKQFYSDFRHEISNHFEYEEKFFFPLLKSFDTSNLDLSSFDEDPDEVHTGIVDKLDDLTQIVYKYLPGNVMPEETMELVFDILQLSSDIRKHAMIEEKILLPCLEMMERRKN